MLTRSLVYTAITRAKSKVILVGQIGMLYMAVHKDDTGKRNTQLGHRISLYCRLQRSKELRSFPVSEIFDTEADNHRAMASGIRSLQEQLAEVDALSLLESAKQQYNGVARLGIEAMQLKFIGLSNTDIAAYYGVKANYLGAAVHRAAERLRNNAEFLNSLEYEPLKKSSKAS